MTHDDCSCGLLPSSPNLGFWQFWFVIDNRPGTKSLADELGGARAAGRANSSSLSDGVGASQPVKKWSEK